MRDARLLLLLSLCLLHTACQAKPVAKQDDKRARVSTKAILQLESQLKDMAGEEDNGKEHKTTVKVPQTRPVDEAEDNPTPVQTANGVAEPEKPADGGGEALLSDHGAPPSVAEAVAEEAARQQAAAAQAAKEKGEDEPPGEPDEEKNPEESPPQVDQNAIGPSREEEPLGPQEEELFDRFMGMAEQHPELMDISLDDFEQLVQRLQEKEEEEELDLRAQAAARQGLLPPDMDDSPLSPEQRLEKLQELHGDQDARVVAKKRVIPPADVLRRRADQLQQMAQLAGSATKRQKETPNVYKKDGKDSVKSKSD